MAALGETVNPTEAEGDYQKQYRLLRHFGTDAMIRRIEREERHHVSEYQAQVKSLGDPDSCAILARVIPDEQAHAERLREMAAEAQTGPRSKLDSLLAREKWHAHGTGSWIGDAIYGINDGLGAVFGIVSGVAGATGADSKFVLIAGLMGMIGSAFSMGSSAYLAAKSEREVHEAEIARERREIETDPAHEREELELMYQIKGFSEDEARTMADRITSLAGRIFANHGGGGIGTVRRPPAQPVAFRPCRHVLYRDWRVPAGAALLLRSRKQCRDSISGYLYRRALRGRREQDLYHRAFLAQAGTGNDLCRNVGRRAGLRLWSACRSARNALAFSDTLTLMKNRYLALLIICLIGAAAQAQPAVSPGAAPAAPPESLSVERPGYTNGTETVPPGHYQLELGYAYANGGGGYQNRFLDGSQIRFPINQRTEWRVGFPAYVTAKSGEDSVSGFGDSSVSVKWRFLDAAPKRPSLALILNSTLPTGRRDVGSHYFQPGFLLEAAYTISDKWDVSSNVTYADARTEDARFDQLGVSANLGYAVSDALGVFGEVYRLGKTGADTGGANFFDSGATYLLNPRTQLDLSGGVGLSGDVKNAYFVSFGVARRF